jgi:hypothetical protein
MDVLMKLGNWSYSEAVKNIKEFDSSLLYKISSGDDNRLLKNKLQEASLKGKRLID